MAWPLFASSPLGLTIPPGCICQAQALRALYSEPDEQLSTSSFSPDETEMLDMRPDAHEYWWQAAPDHPSSHRHIAFSRSHVP